MIWRKYIHKLVVPTEQSLVKLFPVSATTHNIINIMHNVNLIKIKNCTVFFWQQVQNECERETGRYCMSGIRETCCTWFRFFVLFTVIKSVSTLKWTVLCFVSVQITTLYFYFLKHVNTVYNTFIMHGHYRVYSSKGYLWWCLCAILQETYLTQK